ncbi:mannitol dehydrogenase family protein [Marivita sp. S6314]|uniref:mannitol dehydrogenase family protein n=1 Tax=Marivita sp. S6314 TaxID=2926406 RepID=UPI001FF6BCDE|nr:mannitol dehydrogenase family protein [Marivita sp. S6314]MCK0150763.1 mannitol dehydrogenase family protein [Marivita sp. S6314]
MDELTPLSNDTLSALPDGVRVPRYDRASLTAGIVHIGLGNFHRAHQAWYLHRLFDEGLSLDWAIIGAGVRAADAAQRDRLLAQDCLTTLIELDPSHSAVEVTGSMIDYLPVQPANDALIAKMADPAIRIVALTVTEGGYYLNGTTGGFDAAHPDIVHDAANPGTPKTAFGAMIAALKLRRDSGAGPFTGMSCDNLQGNGGILRQTVVGLARLSDPDLAEWIDSTCTFPNSMVDCIVPATGPTELAIVHAMGIDDKAPVTHENYRQWVIEDDFCAGRPAWETVGATLTSDVHDYEAMKIRMLNGGHQVLANAGEILGIASISEAMNHPAIHALFNKVQREEIAPYVKPVPGRTPDSYIDLISRRFANPKIVDTTRRVAFDGSSRHIGFILPSIRDALTAGGSVEGLALVEALWARMCQGDREDGTQIEPNDPHWAALNAAAIDARGTPETWLNQPGLYGTLAQEPVFADAFARWLTMLWTDGCEKTLRRYANAPSESTRQSA